MIETEAALAQTDVVSNHSKTPTPAAASGTSASSRYEPKIILYTYGIFSLLRPPEYELLD